jgi:pimeloyl-ACP methyl ester carboxylesterase
VGTSYGGELNLVMGERHPERCHTLVVIASVSHSEAPLAATMARWHAAARRGDAAGFLRAIAPDVYSDAFLAAHPEWLAQAAERAAAFDVQAAVRLIESFQRFDRRAALRAIRVPTCIVSAERDTLKPRAYGEFLHAAIAGSEFHLVPGAGHAVVFERPGEVNSIVLGFLARHPIERRAQT